MTEKPSKIKPAIIGGVVLGLLSSIPIVSAGNICCCLWVLLGGALAARMLIKDSPIYPVTTSDGAVVGVLAGAFGALVNLIIGVPLGLAMSVGGNYAVMEQLTKVVNNPEFSEAIRQQMEMAQHQSMAQRLGGALVFWIIGALITIGFAALGGIIGVALFEKRKGQQMPPPGYPPPPYPPPGSPYQG